MLLSMLLRDVFTILTADGLLQEFIAAMISNLFIISHTGEVLIEKHWRRVVSVL